MAAENLNQLWAGALVDELCRGGARHAVVCPGSRSTPLALACARHEALRTWSVVDERSAGFFALGLAKRCGAPTLLVCTSGSAGAHLFPAVIEASLGASPLVVLTADRPWELHGWGAAQTIDQHRLFGGYPRLFVDLGVPELSPGVLLHLRATAANAAAVALRAPRGVVHLNVPFREPLAPDPDGLPLDEAKASAGGRLLGAPFTRVSVPRSQPDGAALAALGRRLSSTPRGVIVCGPRESADGLPEAVTRLGRRLGYPVLAEAASGVRFGAPEVIAHYDALLRHPPFARGHRPEVILRFGAGLTPRSLQAWIDASGARTTVFSDEGALFDPGHAAEEVIVGDPVSACAALLPERDGGDPRWRGSFLEAERRVRAALEEALGASPSLTEPRVAREAVAALPAGASLFVSSSMPIRDLDAFAPSAAGPLRVFANRGANGIDGIVSTALGIAAAADTPALLLTGDLALLHDLGGLLAARRHRLSLTVVVVNNDGGGIFGFLPIAAHREHYEELFGTPHGVDLSHAAALAGARLWRPGNVSELRAALGESLKGGLHLIEVRTGREENVTLHRALFAQAAAALGEGPWA
ncbi:MAG: 2-succinyl-5-enolpyruvyl-6-hydroxy-3-cyclohexene-1-carboxylic-acid synthase [Myxococcaceae bacterium]